MNEKQKYVYLLKIQEKCIYKIGVSKDVDHELLEALADQQIGLGIDRRGRVVEDEYLRLLQ